MQPPNLIENKPKRKQKKRLNNTKNTKNKTKPTESFFCDDQLLTGMEPILRRDWQTQWCSIGEKQFSLTSRYQWKIVSWFGVGPCPLPLLIAGTFCSLALCRFCVCWHNLCEFLCVSISLHLEAIVALESFLVAGPYNLSTSSSTENSEPWWEGFDENIPIRVESFKVSHSLLFVQLSISLLIIIDCKKMPLWCELSKTIIYGYRRMSPGSFCRFVP